MLPNPLLHRSRRKLGEAVFFLDRLRESAGRHPTFGYFLSAFLSATRSIGFVLQSDLRGRFGTDFDTWWEREKARLPTLRVPIAVVAELRNHALKRGELLPGMTMVVRLQHPVVEEIRFTLDLRDGRIAIASEDYRFRVGEGPTLHLSDAENGEEVSRAIERVLPELRELFRSLNEDEPGFDISGISHLLEPGGSAMSFTELIAGLSEHVEAMRNVLEAAEREFR